MVGTACIDVFLLLTDMTATPICKNPILMSRRAPVSCSFTHYGAMKESIDIRPFLRNLRMTSAGPVIYICLQTKLPMEN